MIQLIIICLIDSAIIYSLASSIYGLRIITYMLPYRVSVFGTHVRIRTPSLSIELND